MPSNNCSAQIPIPEELKMTKITKNDQKERKIYLKKSEKKLKKNPKSDNLKKIFCQKSDFLSVSKY
jgi:hypothetical protein